MSYADQKMGGNRLVVLIIVAALHVVLAYGLVTGLAFEAVKQVTKRVTTIDIEEPGHLDGGIQRRNGIVDLLDEADREDLDDEDELAALAEAPEKAAEREPVADEAAPADAEAAEQPARRRWFRRGRRD